MTNGVVLIFIFIAVIGIGLAVKHYKDIKNKEEIKNEGDKEMVVKT